MSSWAPAPPRQQQKRDLPVLGSNSGFTGVAHSGAATEKPAPIRPPPGFGRGKCLERNQFFIYVQAKNMYHMMKSMGKVIGSFDSYKTLITFTLIKHC